MKISGLNNNFEISCKNAAPVQKTAESQKAAKSTHDKIEIDFSKVRTQAKPTEYQLKLQNIQQQLHQGTYQVDPQKIAEKLLAHTRKEAK